MNRVLSMPARRSGVIVNYLSAVLLAAVFCVGEYSRWTPPLLVAAILAAAIAASSAYLTLIRTGLWRLTHARFETLDEREVQVAHRSLRHSYTIFTALCLSLIVFIVLSVRFSFLTLTWRGHYSFGLAVLIFLQYLVQTLPASIVAWTEKEVLLP